MSGAIGPKLVLEFGERTPRAILQAAEFVLVASAFKFGAELTGSPWLNGAYWLLLLAFSGGIGNKLASMVNELFDLPKTVANAAIIAAINLIVILPFYVGIAYVIEDSVGALVAQLER